MSSRCLSVFRTVAICLAAAIASACDSGSEVDELLQRVDIAAQQIQSVQLSGSLSPISLGSERNGRQLSLLATSANGSSPASLTSLATWSSSNPQVATVDETGLVIPVAGGSTTITAQYGPFSDAVSLQVSDAALLSIEISGGESIDECGSTQLVAEGTFSDRTDTLTDLVNWQVASEDNALGFFSAAESPGLLRASGAESGQTINVTATAGSVTGQASVSVSSDPQSILRSIQITRPGNILRVGEDRAQDYRATGTYENDSARIVTDSAQWNLTGVSPADSITVDNDIPGKGTLTASRVGTATLTVSCGGIDEVIQVTAANTPAVDSFFLSPRNSPLVIDADQRTHPLRLFVRFVDDTEQDLTEQADWDATGDTGALDISDSSGSKGIITVDRPGTIQVTVEINFNGTIHTLTVEVQATSN